MNFTEPNQGFELRSGVPLALRVYQGAENVPPWADEVLSAPIEHDATSPPRAPAPAGVEHDDAVTATIWLDCPVREPELYAIEEPARGARRVPGPGAARRATHHRRSHHPADRAGSGAAVLRDEPVGAALMKWFAAQVWL